jgi:hypothetical protein
MRRRTLTLGVFLILLAVFVLEQGVQVFAPIADLAGLTTHYTRENVILPPTIYSVPGANYSFASEDLTGGGHFVGALQVTGGREVGFYVMNEGNFSLWRAGRPASLILVEPMAISYNFTLSPSVSGTYYFVFDNQDSSPNVVIFSLSSVQDVTVLNPLVQYAGFELLLLGVVLSFLGVGGGKRKVKEKPAPAKAEPARVQDSGWNCKFCGARNSAEDHMFCSKCGRAQN